MQKTPDEIKKGLVSCISVGKCWTECPYFAGEALPFTCIRALSADALALIQQLQAENAEKDARIKQLEAERDAAVESMRSDPHCCYHCANMTKRGICQSEPRADGHCFEWRGVQKEG